MALPSLADLPALEVRIPEGILTADEGRAQAALDDASALIRSEAGLTWVTDDQLDVPDIIVTICITAARRAFLNPEGVSSEVVGDTSTTLASPEVYLTKDEKALIRKTAGKSGIWTQATTRGDVTDTPAIHPPGVLIDAPSEEVDPFDEGWAS